MFSPTGRHQRVPCGQQEQPRAACPRGGCRGSPTVPQRSPARDTADPLEVVAGGCVPPRGPWSTGSLQTARSPVFPLLQLGAGFRAPIRGVGSCASKRSATRAPCLSPTMLSEGWTVCTIAQSTFIHPVAPRHQGQLLAAALRHCPRSGAPSETAASLPVTHTDDEPFAANHDVHHRFREDLDRRRSLGDHLPRFVFSPPGCVQRVPFNLSSCPDYRLVQSPVLHWTCYPERRVCVN